MFVQVNERQQFARFVQPRCKTGVDAGDAIQLLFLHDAYEQGSVRRPRIKTSTLQAAGRLKNASADITSIVTVV
jgi:hypothetical protein